MNSDGFPIVVVLQCSESDNNFVWMHLIGANRGRAIACDFLSSRMWSELLGKNYHTILRGFEEIELTWPGRR
jgi:hypothetical protein